MRRTMSCLVLYDFCTSKTPYTNSDLLDLDLHQVWQDYIMEWRDYIMEWRPWRDYIMRVRSMQLANQIAVFGCTIV